MANFKKTLKYWVAFCISIAVVIYKYSNAKSSTIQTKTTKILNKSKPLSEFKISEDYLKYLPTKRKTEIHRKNISFAIVTINNEQHNEIINEFIRNKKEYTALLGYKLIVEEPLDKSRKPTWTKLLSALEAFKRGYEWIWLLDRDTIITNFNIKVHELTNLASRKNFDILISKDCQAINAGSILVRNTEFSRNFFNILWNSYGHEISKIDEWCEQRALIYFHNKTNESRKKILFLPQNSINAYPIENKDCQTNEREWKVGHFVLHFAGIHNGDIYRKYLNLNKELKKNLRINPGTFNTKRWLNYINKWLKTNHQIDLMN